MYAWPEGSVNDFNYLLNHLRVIYSGTIIGELVRDKLVPAHALAMSSSVAGLVPRTAVDHDQAISFLQRKEMQDWQGLQGWQLLTHLGYNLGWVNGLPNRVNNYYPKELRILKDR